jgi:hypothetical protein
LWNPKLIFDSAYYSLLESTSPFEHLGLMNGLLYSKRNRPASLGVKRAAQRLALAAVGGRVDLPSKRKKLKARKMPKNAVRTHRQLHALLGG